VSSGAYSSILELTFLSREEDMESTACKQIYSRIVADALLTRLPRHLREYIYGYFWEQDLDVSKDRLLRRAMARPTDYLPRHYLMNTWLTDSVYLGEIVTDEILSHLYRMCFTSYEEPIIFASAHDFLSSDVYQRNLTPTLFIQTLNLRWNHFAMSPQEKSDIAAALKALRHVQFPAPISIHLVLDGYYVDRRMRKVIMRKLQNFRRTCEALEQKGHMIKVTEEDLGMDLTGFYSMSKDAWIESMNDATYEDKGIEEV
jgi:hypothetical protein